MRVAGCCIQQKTRQGGPTGNATLTRITEKQEEFRKDDFLLLWGIFSRMKNRFWVKTRYNCTHEHLFNQLVKRLELDGAQFNNLQEKKRHSLRNPERPGGVSDVAWGDRDL